MNETQVSLAGIIFLISALCACGSGEQSFEALAAKTGGADTTASNDKGKSPGNSQGKGKGRSAKDDADDEETCDAGKLADPTTVVLCVGVGGTEPEQVCTDAKTALSKYGLDPSRPNTVALNGDHIGSC